jgi:acyl-CoA synthetase (AMP-forming)/AMP-acid ligase II
MHLAQLLRRNATVHRNRPAYVQDDEVWTWGQTYDRVMRLANALLAHGVRGGDRVMTFGPAGIEDIEMYLACARIGAIRVGLNPRLTAQEVAEHMVVAEPSAVCVGSEHAATLLAALELVPEASRPHLFVGSGADRHDLEYDYAKLIAGASSAEPGVELDDKARVAITFTSGSTGRPKGVIFTNDRLLTHMYTSTLSIGVRQDDVWLQNMPTFGAPICMATWNLLLGNTTVVMRSFDIDLEMQLIERYRVTAFANSATTIARLIDHPEFDRYDLSSIRTIMYGQGPASPSLLRRAYKRLPTGFFQAYSTTEGTVGFFTALTQADHAAAFADPSLDWMFESAGRPLSSVDLSVVRDDGSQCELGEQGEVRVSGEVISPGYWRDPVNDAEFFRPDGLYTGDIGYLDDHGFLHLVDRKSFMIMSGGIKIASVEIENVIAEVPAVEQVCVVGVPDQRWGEAVVAVVVPRDPAAAEPLREQIIAHCRSRMAGYKVPKAIRFVAGLPTSPQGKLLKKEVRAMLTSDQRLTGVV